MSSHPGISSFICSVHNPAAVSPCVSRTQYGRLAGDLFVPLLYGERVLPAVLFCSAVCVRLHDRRAGVRLTIGGPGVLSTNTGV